MGDSSSSEMVSRAKLVIQNAWRSSNPRYPGLDEALKTVGLSLKEFKTLWREMLHLTADRQSVKALPIGCGTGPRRATLNWRRAS